MTTEDPRAAYPNDPTTCWCRYCHDASARFSRTPIVCPDCGDTHCQRANHHGNGCTAAATPPPPLAGAGEGEKAARAQALRDDVRRKFLDALPTAAEVGRWFRLEEILDEADAQAKENAALRAKLAQEGEQERALLKRDEELRGLRAMLARWDGDGGAGVLMSLADYFHENGNRAAYLNIRAAGHNAGFCLDSGGADHIAPTTDACPLCGYFSPAAPELGDWELPTAALPLQGAEGREVANG